MGARRDGNQSGRSEEILKKRSIDIGDKARFFALEQKDIKRHPFAVFVVVLWERASWVRYA